MSKLLLIVYFSIFAFDFRREDSGGAAWQIAYALTTCALAYLRVLTAGFRGVIIPMRNIGYACVAYLICGGFSAYIYHSNLASYLSVGAPFALIVTTIIMINASIRSGITFAWLFKLLLLISIVSAIWTAFWTLFVLRVPIESARYRILSGAYPYMFAGGLACVLAERRISVLGALATSATVFVGAISLTRALFGMFIVTAAAAVILVVICQRATILRRPLAHYIKRVGLLCAVVLLPMLVAAAVAPGLGQAWIDRLLWYQNTGIGDPTALTRLAEWRGMWEEMSGRPLSYIIGKGIGGQYFWSAAYVTELYAYSEEIRFTSQMTQAGHSVFVYIAFSCGLVGIALGLYIVVVAWREYWRAVAIMKSVRTSSILPEYVIGAGLICVAFLSQTMTANPLSSRLGGVYVGATLAFATWLRYEIYRRPSGSVKQRPPRSIVDGATNN